MFGYPSTAPFANLTELCIWAGDISIILPKHVPLKLLQLGAMRKLMIASDSMNEVTQRLESATLAFDELPMGESFLKYMAHHGKPLCEVAAAFESDMFGRVQMSVDGLAFARIDRWKCSTRAPLSRCGTCMGCAPLKGVRLPDD